MVLMGEMQQRQRERFTQLPLLAQHSEEAAKAREACKEEIVGQYSLLCKITSYTSHIELLSPSILK
jgi:hypothetical protein